MIVVKVELWPGGDRKRAREIGRMTITNDGTSHSPRRGDYGVKLMRKGTTNRIQRQGDVKGHARQSYSVWVLVKKALDAVGM